MAELQQTRYDRLIRRVGGIIGPGSMVSEAITELFPMLDVENVPGELLVLAGTHLAYGGDEVAAAAGNISRLQLFNPAGSSVLITIERALVCANAAAVFIFGIREGLPLLTNTNDGVFRDTRLGIVPRAVGEIRIQNNNPTTAPSFATIRSPANVPSVLDDRNGVAVLSPGFGWEISSTAQNQLLNGTIFWRERAAERSELNF